MSKKPWIWGAWRSMAMTRSTPTLSKSPATSLALMGSRPSVCLSWRA